jgi:phage-related protein
LQLRRVQQALEPNYWKPMPTIGPGVPEIPIHTNLEHRVFYVATFSDAVYLLARLGIHVQFVVKPSRRRNVA